MVSMQTFLQFEKLFKSVGKKIILNFLFQVTDKLQYEARQLSPNNR